MRALSTYQHGLACPALWAIALSPSVNELPQKILRSSEYLCTYQNAHLEPKGEDMQREVAQRLLAFWRLFQEAGGAAQDPDFRLSLN